MRRILSVYTILCMLLFLIICCGKSIGNGEITSEVLPESERNIEIETENAKTEENKTDIEKETETQIVKYTESMCHNYTYGIRKNHLDYTASVTGVNFEKPEGIDAIPILEVYIPGNQERENRINKAIAEQCVKLLPMNKDWLDNVEMQVIYRSERYLCYEYVSRKALPEKYGNMSLPLYVTVDLKKEIAIEYLADLAEVKGFSWYDRVENVEQIKKEYITKSVEEQNSLRGDTDYEVYQSVWGDNNGLSFSCVQVKGMKDEKKQYKVNQALREPLAAVTEAGSAQKEFLREKLQGINIYIAYKSEQWLSVEYSFRIQEPYVYEPYGDGVVDFGVTVDMQTGERVMMDDLFAMQKFTEWWCLNLGNMDEVKLQRRMERAIVPEKVVIKNWDIGEGKISSALNGMLSMQTFYLYKGRIVLSDAWGDVGIPLQDVSQYLKVDPWYD